MVVHLTLDNKDLAKTYDEISDSQFNNGRLLVEKLEIKAGDSILDIGSGTGRLGRHVIEIIGPSGTYLGIDPLEDRIKLANEKNQHPNAEFQIGTAEDLSSIGDNRFDVVYLNAVFHWVVDKATALKEIFRVLKPGGKIGIATGAWELNSITGIRLIIDTVLKREPYSSVVNVENSTQNQHGLKTTQLVELLAEANFKVKDVQIKESKRSYESAEDITKFNEASSFGNYLNHVPESLRDQAKRDIEAEFENHRSKNGLQFSHYTIYAVAKKAKQK